MHTNESTYIHCCAKVWNIFTWDFNAKIFHTFAPQCIPPCNTPANRCHRKWSLRLIHVNSQNHHVINALIVCKVKQCLKNSIWTVPTCPHCKDTISSFLSTFFCSQSKIFLRFYSAEWNILYYFTVTIVHYRCAWAKSARVLNVGK